jgi:hypothetical protein
MAKLTHSGHTPPSGTAPAIESTRESRADQGDAAIAGAFMTDPITVPHGAIQACDVQDDVHWLQPRSAQQGTALNARSREAFRQVTVSLGLGALLTFGSAGAAVAPAAASTKDVEAPSASTNAIERQFPPVETVANAIERQLPQVETVAAAPIAIPAADRISSGETGNTTPIVLASTGAVDTLEADRAARDPQELIQFDRMRVPRWIVETILRASEHTGVDPVYMMALADKESSFIPANKANTSSAEGLFQFISSTWLEVVKTFGARHGLEGESAAIETVKGELTIVDDEMRERVLGLRRDPYLCALMAAEMMKRDRSKIERRLGREITRSEFYLAHFFGVDSASKFMSLVDGKPKQSAPKVFPRAAKANKKLFFAKKGKKTRHLSVAEVYEKLDQMIDKRLDRYEDVTDVLTADASL